MEQVQTNQTHKKTAYHVRPADPVNLKQHVKKSGDSAKSSEIFFFGLG